MICWWRWFYCGLMLLGCTSRLWAGGSGLNVVVVVNQNSSSSVQLGNYYCEQRQIPPQNLLRVNWTGGKIQWTKADFESVLLNPLLAMLAQRQLTNQIDYVVLSMDLPYRVVHSGSPSESGINSTTSALFYGFKPDSTGFSLPSCNLPNSSSNAYAGSEGIFRATLPTTATSNYFMVTMLTSSNLAEAKLVVDRAVTSDGSFPTQTVWLAHSDDRLRNIRYWLYDDAIFNTRLRGNYFMRSTNFNGPNGLGFMAGFQGGIALAPVAIADAAVTEIHDVGRLLRGLCCGHGQVECALVVIGDAALVKGLAVIGVELDGLIDVGHRLIELLPGVVGHAAIVECQRVLVVEFDGAIVVGDRAVAVALGAIG